VSEPWRPAEVVDRYRSLLTAVGSVADELDDVTLTSHWPLVGTAPRRVLVIGQAVFGWIPSWHASRLSTPAGVDEILAETLLACYEREDPMDWIVENRARASPFWRTVLVMIERLYPDSVSPWYSHVAWANLYPVARNDVKGNPDGTLRDVQTRPAAELVDAIARALDPDLTLVLAGTFWWPFTERLALTESLIAERPLLGLGRRHGRPWIIGMHPGGAQRRGWGASAYADWLVAGGDRLSS
jgi:hypothetical protein